MNTKILRITRTAIFMALLLVLHAAAAPLGNIIAGSIVNLILIVSVMTCGLASGLSVAVISPVMAKFFGIGPLFFLMLFIAGGNIVLVLLWHFIGSRHTTRKYTAYFTAMVSSATAKLLALYIGNIKIALPLFWRLPEQQTSVISDMFSISQFVTALTGGILSIILLSTLKKAMGERRG